MGLLGLYMGKVTRVRKKLVGSAVFLILVRPLVFSDPACAENRAYDFLRQSLINNGTSLLFVSGEGRTEHQKQNQTTSNGPNFGV